MRSQLPPPYRNFRLTATGKSRATHGAQGGLINVSYKAQRKREGRERGDRCCALPRRGTMHGFCKCVVLPLCVQLIVLSALDAHNNMAVPVGQNVSLQCPTVSRVSPKQPTVHWEWTGKNHRAPLQLAEGSLSHGTFNARYNIDALRMFGRRLAMWRQRGSPSWRQDVEFTLGIAHVRSSDQGVFTCSLTWENGSRSVNSVLLEVLRQGVSLLVTSAAVTSTVQVVTPSTGPNSGDSLRWVVVPTGLLLASLTVLLVAATRSLRRRLLANRAALLDADFAKSVQTTDTASLRLPEDHSSPPDHTVKHYESMRKIIPTHAPAVENTADQYIYEDMANLA
ncbi:uncharacterized protein LOC103091772 isoform X2 [Petromyzon marinus]|uniref:Uncharacterized protein LOC103091772 isoform X2 n=1 Tax=Petromyzon marinus TaxID=7757 RepID=A0AAJ7WV92_PETMA|nr:uncharacterized protein LOC103091772 isoform X2 [Petromyzon marinus]